jgi:uncharacterized protein
MVDRQLFVGTKLAEVCNLACPYCYFFEQNDDSHLSAPRYMSPEVMRAAARFLAQGAKELDLKTISIALHGGEPLLIGKKRFVECCQVFREAIEPYATLNLAVQTNGLPLDREWIELIAAQGCRIGLSLDGPKEANDAARPDKRGIGSYDRIVKALRLLQDCVKEKVIPSFGVLTVIGPRVSGKEVYRHIVSDLGIQVVDFQLPLLHWDTFDENIVQYVTEFYRDITQCWFTSNDPAIDIRTLRSMFRPFLHDTAADTRLNYISDLMEGISIRSNGDVCPDDALPPIAKKFRHTGFNVHQHSLKSFYDSDLWKDIRATLLDPPQECRQCEWFGLCGGGPIENRYSTERQFHNKTIYCETYKAIFSSIRKYVSKYIDQETIERRLASASQALQHACVPHE